MKLVERRGTRQPLEMSLSQRQHRAEFARTHDKVRVSQPGSSTPCLQLRGIISRFHFVFLLNEARFNVGKSTRLFPCCCPLYSCSSPSIFCLCWHIDSTYEGEHNFSVLAKHVSSGHLFFMKYVLVIWNTKKQRVKWSRMCHASKLY